MPDNTFDPIRGRAYALCFECKIQLETEDDVKAHLHQTLEVSENRQSHTLQRMNFSRGDRIQTHVDNLVIDALRELTAKIAQLIENDKITCDEADTAVTPWSDLAQEWDGINTYPPLSRKE